MKKLHPRIKFNAKSNNERTLNVCDEPVKSEGLQIFSYSSPQIRHFGERLQSVAVCLILFAIVVDCELIQMATVAAAVSKRGCHCASGCCCCKAAGLYVQVKMHPAPILAHSSEHQPTYIAISSAGAVAANCSANVLTCSLPIDRDVSETIETILAIQPCRH
jgi:hypothetical protein